MRASARSRLNVDSIFSFSGVKTSVYGQPRHSHRFPHISAASLGNVSRGRQFVLARLGTVPGASLVLRNPRFAVRIDHRRF